MNILVTLDKHYLSPLKTMLFSMFMSNPDEEFDIYSDCNIHNNSLLEALSSPLMQAFHRHYPFSDHILRTCPLLENPDQLYQIIKEAQASNSEYFDHESIFHLCAKCSCYAAKWKESTDHLISEISTFSQDESPSV